MVSSDRIHYKRNVLISLILSETILILTFLFFPKFLTGDKEIIIGESLYLSEIIPPTLQKISSAKPPPKVQNPVISDEVDAFDLLDDVEILSSDIVPEISKTATTQTGITNTSPRLTYEILPENKENLISGTLNLSLKIDKTGRVIEHKILRNSIECERCLKKLIDIVYRSRWEPAYKNGSRIADWVQKSYVFN
jgi:hypothetical protein